MRSYTCAHPHTRKRAYAQPTGSNFPAAISSRKKQLGAGGASASQLPLPSPIGASARGPHASFAHVLDTLHTYASPTGSPSRKEFPRKEFPISPTAHRGPAADPHLGTRIWGPAPEETRLRKPACGKLRRSPFLVGECAEGKDGSAGGPAAGVCRCQRSSRALGALPGSNFPKGISWKQFPKGGFRPKAPPAKQHPLGPQLLLFENCRRGRRVVGGHPSSQPTCRRPTCPLPTCPLTTNQPPAPRRGHLLFCEHLLCPEQHARTFPPRTFPLPACHACPSRNPPFPAAAFPLPNRDTSSVQLRHVLCPIKKAPNAGGYKPPLRDRCFVQIADFGLMARSTNPTFRSSEPNYSLSGADFSR